MRESVAFISGLMPRSPSRCLACSLVSAELGIGTLRMSRLKTAKLFREHSDRGGSSAIVFIYLHATRHTAERRYLY